MSVLLVIIFCVSPQTIKGESKPSLLKQFQSIVKHTTSQSKTKKTRSQFEKELENRRKRLRGLLQRNSKVATNTGEDILTLAMCCELLGERQLCLNYCRQCSEKDPNEYRIYAPWIRTLLNLDKPAEAEEILTQATRRFEENFEVRSLHHLLFIEGKQQKNDLLAARHIRPLVELLFDRFDSGHVAAASSLLQLYDEFVETYEQIGEGKKATFILNDQRRRLQLNCLDHSKQAAAMHLNSELTRLSDIEHFEQSLIRWVTHTGNNLVENPKNRRSADHFRESLKYISNHSFHLGSCDQLEVSLGVLENKLADQSNPVLRLHRSGVRQIIQLIKLRHQHISVIGKTAPPLAAKWLQKGPDQEEAEKRPVLIHFWAPSTAQPMSGFALGNELRKRCPELVFRSVAVYSGSKIADGKEIPISNESEERMIREFCRIQKIQGCIGVVDEKENDFAKLAAVKFLPQFVLVDSQNRVDRIGVGVSKALAIDLNRRFRSMIGATEPQIGGTVKSTR